MKKLFPILSLALVLTGCAGENGSQQSGDLEFKTAQQRSDGSFVLESTVLEGVDSLEALAGRFARFLYSPGRSGSRLVGESASTRYLKNQNGTYVATDVLSLELSTLYFHMQSLAKLDAAMGVGSLNEWPRTIAVRARTTEGTVNNAYYDSETDSLVFVPYTRSEVPVSVNPGVIAHEHFHSIFNKLVISPLLQGQKFAGLTKNFLDHQESEPRPSAPQTTDFKIMDPAIAANLENVTTAQAETYHRYLLRSLNEGIADYWGWMYSGQVDFVRLSLREAGKRSLEVQSLPELPTTKQVMGEVLWMKWRGEPDYYEYGTRYAQILKGLSDKISEARNLSRDDSKHLLAKAIVKTLPLMRENILKTQGNEVYRTEQFLVDLVQRLDDLQTSECELLVGKINSLAMTNESYSCVAHEGAATQLVKTETGAN